MRNIVAGAALLIAGTLNAQWDTLNTGTEIRWNAIAAHNTMGVVVCGVTPPTDSGGLPIVYASGDNGNSWAPFFSYYDNDIELWDVDFSPSGALWAIGDSGVVIYQTLWFPSYIYIGQISPYTLKTGFAVNDSVFYCAGEQGVLYRTTRSGYNWDSLNTGTTETINDIYFTDAANGWIVGDGGFIATTADSGNTWTFVAQPQFGFTDFTGFAYQDTMGLNPYIVGEAGSGQFSINGGVNWFAFATGTTQDIHKIRFMNTISGVMCGNEGYIQRSEDGGGSWFNDPAPVTVDLHDVAFAGDTTAFICGDSGVVLRSRTDISSAHHASVPKLAANVYPNPTAGPLFVEVLSEENDNVEIQLIDLAGQVLHAGYYQNVSAGINRFDVGTNGLAPGIYFLQIKVNAQVMTLPVIRN